MRLLVIRLLNHHDAGNHATVVEVGHLDHIGPLGGCPTQIEIHLEVGRRAGNQYEFLAIHGLADGVVQGYNPLLSALSTLVETDLEGTGCRVRVDPQTIGSFCRNGELV